MVKKILLAPVVALVTAVLVLLRIVCSLVDAVGAIIVFVLAVSVIVTLVRTGIPDGQAVLEYVPVLAAMFLCSPAGLPLLLARGLNTLCVRFDLWCAGLYGVTLVRAVFRDAGAPAGEQDVKQSAPRFAGQFHDRSQYQDAGQAYRSYHKGAGQTHRQDAPYQEPSSSHSVVSRPTDLQKAMDLFMVDDLSTTNQDTLRQRYHNLQKAFHPDVNDVDTTEQSRRINEAYELLKNAIGKPGAG